MKIAIGADHAGYPLKAYLQQQLETNGYQLLDQGTSSEEKMDYPDIAHPVAELVESGEADYGVLVCGSGVGVSITANKHQGIRAVLAWMSDIARLSRQHNDANVLCLPGRFVAQHLAWEMLQTFLTTEFEGGRHHQRVAKMGC